MKNRRHPKDGCRKKFQQYGDQDEVEWFCESLSRDMKWGHGLTVNEWMKGCDSRGVEQGRIAVL